MHISWNIMSCMWVCVLLRYGLCDFELNELPWTESLFNEWPWFMGPTWGPSGADSPQVGPMLAPWTLLSGELHKYLLYINREQSFASAPDLPRGLINNIKKHDRRKIVKVVIVIDWVHGQYGYYSGEEYNFVQSRNSMVVKNPWGIYLVLSIFFNETL